MPAEPAPAATQAGYVDLATQLVLRSIAEAADAKRHGYDQLKITYHAGEIRQVEFVPATTYKI